MRAHFSPEERAQFVARAKALMEKGLTLHAAANKISEMEGGSPRGQTITLWVNKAGDSPEEGIPREGGTRRGAASPEGGEPKAQTLFRTTKAVKSKLVTALDDMANRSGGVLNTTTAIQTFFEIVADLTAAGALDFEALRYMHEHLEDLNKSGEELSEALDAWSSVLRETWHDEVDRRKAKRVYEETLEASRAGRRRAN